MINGPDEKHILKAREKQENWWHKKDDLLKITPNVWLSIKKGPNDFIFWWLECFLREKISNFQEFQPTMSDDIYNRWWLHVRGALSPIAGSLPKGMWLTRRSISIIQESLTRFEKFVNHQSLSERTCREFSTRTHVDCQEISPFQYKHQSLSDKVDIDTSYLPLHAIGHKV